MNFGRGVLLAATAALALAGSVTVAAAQESDGTHPMLVKFAENVLPKLQQHRDRAVSLWSGTQ